MSIKRILLRNFQRHRRLELKLSPGVNCVVGPNDHGKTAVVRAVRWLAFNRPSGTRMVNWNASGCQVGIALDGHKVERVRSGKRNLYKLDKGEYLASGKGVPEVVADLLNLSDLNFQNQQDPHFWLNLPPAQAAKELNKAVDLSLADEALRRAGADVRAVQAELKVWEELAERRTDEINELSWVPQAVRARKRVQKYHTLISHRTRSNERLRELVVRAGETLDLRQGASQKAEAASNALRLAEKCRKLAERRARLAELAESLAEALKRCRSVRYRLDAVQLELDAVELCPTCGQPRLS